MGITFNAVRDLTAFSPDVERSIVDHRIRIAMRSGVRTPITSAAGVVALSAALSYSGQEGRFVASFAVLTWASVMIALLAAGSLLCALVSRGGRSASQMRAVIAIYMAQGIAVGAAWASVLWLFMSSASPAAQVLLVTTVSTVMCGGISSQATYAPFVRSFAFGISVVASSALVYQGGVYYTTIALGLTILPLHVLLFARTLEQAVTESLRLALVNESLHSREAELRRAADSLRAEAEEARARAERAHREAETARVTAVRADQAKAMVIAATSHDLRQPLHALVNYVAHLRRDLAPSERADTVVRVEESLAILHRLLDAVLEFSELSGGRGRAVVNEPVAMPALLRHIETQIRPSTEAQGIALHVRSANVTVSVDAALLTRVLLNLAQNALRYTHAGSIALRLSVRASVVRVLVADTGIGIPAHERDRIFDDYYQIGNAARDRRLGLGLGLAIVRELTATLGFRLRLKSLPGVGSVFAIEIPVSRLIQTDATRERDTRPPAALHGVDFVRGAHVLLIDDDALARDGLALTLADFGCRVTTAASAEDAIIRVAESGFVPQLLLTDYRLADGTTGIDAIRRVRSHLGGLSDEQCPLPALVVSGDTSADTERIMARAGYRLLRKPLAPEILHSALSDALRELADGTTGSVVTQH